MGVDQGKIKDLLILDVAPKVRERVCVCVLCVVALTHSTHSFEIRLLASLLLKNAPKPVSISAYSSPFY